MRNVMAGVVFACLMTGCGDDMPIPRTPVSWPLTGGLDTHKGPLAIQPGSHLVLDNVIQERLNEWRRRNGFTQSASDTMGSALVAPYFVGAIGDAGMVAVTRSSSAWIYSPSATTRWSFGATGSMTGVRRRTSVGEAAVNQIGFARLGNVVAVASVIPTGTSTLTFVDKESHSDLATTAGTWLVARGAALGTKLLMFFVDTAGVLGVVSFDTATGVATTTASLKTGLHTTAPWLDARYADDGGATVTVVARSSTNAVVFLEYNPATGALAANTTVTGVSCDSTLALLAPSSGNASARRYVASSHSTPTTRVTVVDATGAVVVNDQVQAIASTQITGVSTGGSNWAVAYRTTTPNLRVNVKAGGVIDSPSDLNQSPFWGATGFLDSQGWQDQDTSNWQVLIGLHSQNPDDPQDSWVEMTIQTGASAARVLPMAVVESLAAAPKLTVPHALYQVQRMSSGKFSSVLPVQVVYEDNAGTIVRHFGLNLFEETYLQQSDVAAEPTEKPVSLGRAAFLPIGQLSVVSRGQAFRLGSFTPPRILAAVSSVGAGALTPAAQYGWVAVEELIDRDGNIWRSPPTAPILVTMGASDNTATVTYSSWALELVGLTRRVGIYRTAANGSSYRRITSFTPTPGLDVIYVDLLADSVQSEGEVLYTIGELSTAITPPARAVWFHDDRMFVINAEYPTEVWYTKNLRPGRQPEFTNEMIVDQDDNFGECTNGAHLDDKSVLFKRNAIYFSQGDGFTDSGSGTNYSWTQVSGDVGAIAGSPVVGNGQKLWFVSERGIYAVDKQGNVDFDGEAVDQYLNQPLVQARETVYDGVFLPSSNEVVFLTTNYLLVRNLTFGTWTRWTGLAGFRRALVVNGQLVLFRNDGSVWRQGDHTQLTDNGTAFTGNIRSPWMRPTQGVGGPGTASSGTTSQQGLRAYSGRVVYTRTAGGASVSLTGRIYLNNDNSQVETFTSDGIDGTVLSATGEMKPRNQKCTAFSLELVLPSGDVTVRVDGFAAVIGTRNDAQAVDAGQRWKP